MTVANLKTLTEAEIQQLAKDWYLKLDVHAPLEDYVPFLAEEGLEMRFPEATVYGFEGFKGWYERVIGIFFDEVHTVKQVKVSPSGDKANVEVIVKWEASVWKAPAAKSERIVLDAYQTWVVKRSPNTGLPVIEIYIVDSLDYYEGSAKL
jgi:sulfate adenylyltransferase subunit 1 (EFTu-like GTPase family)